LDTDVVAADSEDSLIDHHTNKAKMGVGTIEAVEVGAKESNLNHVPKIIT
jgi:hypothetical protein